MRHSARIPILQRWIPPCPSRNAAAGNPNPTATETGSNQNRHQSTRMGWLEAGYGNGAQSHASKNTMATIRGHCAHSWLKKNLLQFGCGRFETGDVGDIERFGCFINAFHEPGQGSAGAKFDETGEALCQQV